jgi:predicted NAD/FAD-binding protein
MGAEMQVAVIGTGIAGNAAAWTLSRRYPVTVYDRELRPGGHSHTVTIDYDGTPLSVDIGFIVYNELNYPDLTALFAHLGVETVESCMSFAVTADAGRFEWKGGGNNWRDTARGLFAQASNLLLPADAARHPDLQHKKRRGPYRRQTDRAFARRVFCLAQIRAETADRLSGPDGRRDLVGSGERDAGLSGRELRRLLQ